MSEPDDLLGKADAFLKRYHPSSTTGQRDVPVLTEVIAEARGPQTQPGALTAAAAQPPVSQADLSELEARLRQSILEGVMAHIAQAIDEQIKDRLRTDLEALVRETVARAVAAEIARLRGPSRSG
jgi:hypothetical protein